MTESGLRAESLAVTTVRGSLYSIGASAVTMVLGFGRSVLMARLLTPEDFGIVAFALTFLNLTTPLRDFGLDQALIHRRPEEDLSLNQALAVHFWLRVILIFGFLLLLAAAMPIIRRVYPERAMLVPILLALTGGEIAAALGSTPTAYLRKEMHFEKLAVLQVLTSLSMTIVGPLLAWKGWGAWAIVGERISGLMVATTVVWVLIHPWRMVWGFDWRMAKWYFHYGKFVLTSRVLNMVVNEFDDFWLGTTMGSVSLGYYSKAYEFAQYPRRMITEPVIRVLFPAFAKIQDDRLRLSKAYFRISSFIVRAGFLLVGSLVLVAREVITLLLGGNWSPMASTFQLMIVYTLLDPLLSVSGNLANATGHPEFVVRARGAQVAFFVPAVVLGVLWGGANGVALAADLMLVLGLGILVYQARNLVDVSFRKMLFLPSLALLAGLAAGLLVGRWTASEASYAFLAMRGVAFAVVYGTLLLLFEHREYRAHLRLLSGLVSSLHGRNSP
jgi:O-antigen/teichoic acid export membrane protein